MKFGPWLMLLITCAGGCSSGRIVCPPYDEIGGGRGRGRGLEPGASVVVRLHNGSEIQGELQEITQDTILLERRYIAFEFETVAIPRAQIDTIEQLRFDSRKTAGLLLGVAAGLVVTLMLALLISPPTSVDWNDLGTFVAHPVNMQATR